MVSTFDLVKHANYIGRFNFNDPRGPEFDWSGSTITARFRGTDLTLKMNPAIASGDDWLNVIIDDGEPQVIRMNKQDNTYVIAEGLEHTVHRVEINKRTEAKVGKLQFLGFELPNGGEFLPPEARKLRRIEFIGDSITCGLGNESLVNSSEYENHYLTYGAIAARALDAEQTTVCISGIGMYQNLFGDREQTMTTLYTNTVLTNKDYAWNFAQSIPDVVVVNLGTNDWGTTVDTEAYKQTYQRFVRAVRNNYKEAHLICAMGSMNMAPAPYVQAVVEHFRLQGDANVHYLEFTQINPDKDEAGRDGHPSVKKHFMMADQLIAAIRKIMDW